MILIVVRHGETEENKKRLLQGQTPGKLTTEGMTSARKLASTLKNKKIDAIFSSDLERAVFTTKQISKFHEIPIYYTKTLRERDVSIFEGKKAEVMHKKVEESGLSHTEFRPKGGESLTDVKRRVEKLLNRIYKRFDSKTVLLSTHGGVIRCLMSIYFDLPLEEARKLRPNSSGIMIINIKNGKARMIKNTMFD